MSPRNGSFSICFFFFFKYMFSIFIVKNSFSSIMHQLESKLGIYLEIPPYERLGQSDNSIALHLKNAKRSVSRVRIVLQWRITNTKRLLPEAEKHQVHINIIKCMI